MNPDERYTFGIYSLLDKVNKIIEDCEYIQESNESEYTKRCAKLSAYNEIAELLGFGGKT